MKKISIMLNGCFGGFRYSIKAIEEYNKRMKKIDPTYISKPTSGYGSTGVCSRFDPVMVEVVRQLGEDASTEYSNIFIDDVFEELKDYIEIKEYDGMESFRYNLSTYKLDKIREITNSQEEPTIKIEKIKTILDMKLEQ